MELFLTSIIGSITFGAIVSVILWFVRDLQSRRELTLALYQEFHSSDFYANVRAPAYKVVLKWNYLPENVKDIYRDAVSSGWSHDSESLIERASLLDIPENPAELYQFHFVQQSGEAYLTEHQALVALLRFWTRINMYRKNRCINNKLTRKLFSDEYGYVDPFFRELVKAMNLAIKKDQDKPSWMRDVSELEKFFGDLKVRL